MGFWPQGCLAKARLRSYSSGRKMRIRICHPGFVPGIIPDFTPLWVTPTLPHTGTFSPPAYHVLMVLPRKRRPQRPGRSRARRIAPSPPGLPGLEPLQCGQCPPRGSARAAHCQGMEARGERWVWDAQGEALAIGRPGGRAGYGMLPPLQVKRPQLPQPPLTGLASQAPHQLHSPALDVLLVVRGPELNPAPEVRPQQSRAQGDIASLALLAAQFLTPATWAHRGSCSGEHQPAWRRRPPQRHAPQPAPLKALGGSLGGAANGLAAGFGSRDPARAVTEAGRNLGGAEPSR